MKTPATSSHRLWCIVVCCCSLAPAASAGGLIDFLFPKHELQAITVTDFTPAGLHWRQPSPAAPLYYAAVSAGYRDFGGIMAGEHMISRQIVNQTMLKVLAKQGYLPARPNQRPDVVLLWTWGTMNAERVNYSVSGYSAQINAWQILRFLGGDKLGLTSKYRDPFPELTLSPGLIYQGGEARNFIDASSDDYFVAVIAAYDVNLRNLKHAVLLWNTRISCPSRGFWLPDAFPGMLAIATPYIGRETTKPVWIRATEKFKPEVRLGDLKVVEYLESNQTAVVDTGPSGN
jgi:hypothetical protein